MNTNKAFVKLFDDLSELLSDLTCKSNQYSSDRYDIGRFNTGDEISELLKKYQAIYDQLHSQQVDNTSSSKL